MKIVLIIDPFECRHRHEWDGEIKFVCNHPHGNAQSCPDDAVFPKDCPLKDYKVKKGVKNAHTTV